MSHFQTYSSSSITTRAINNHKIKLISKNIFSYQKSSEHDDARYDLRDFLRWIFISELPPLLVVQAMDV